MLIVAITIGTLTTKIKREGDVSSEREKQTQTLYRVSKKLLSAMGTDDVVTIGIKYISRLINRTVVCYLEDNNTLCTPFIYNAENKEKDEIILNNNERAVAYLTFSNGKEAGAGTNTFYRAHGYYMPIKGQKKLLGVIGISCSEGFLEPEQKFIFATVASQIAVALDREILSKKQETYKMEIESERLRSNLLRSISHDLRSPLAGIKGAASTIIENGELISEDTKKVLLEGIYEDTEWLIRLVENLLSMTRFDQGKMKINKKLEAVEEVISESIHRSTKNFKEHKIKVNMPENLIMVPMDGNLMEQVFINLIDNAIKFTPKESLIKVNVYEKNENVFFEVMDNGIGISEKILPYIFDRFFTNGSEISDSRRGVGLGLTICKSIVEAHGGRIEVFNNEDHGSTFRFFIPKE
jgi:two-component system sensor histidine kinase KdpD